MVRRLNAAGVPVVGIPLLRPDEGYYCTADNAARAAERYQEWQEWTRRHGLEWAGVGLDIEPDARMYQQIIDNPWGLVPCWFLDCSTGYARNGPDPAHFRRNRRI